MQRFKDQGQEVRNECIRVRDLNPANRYFGRIHRDLNKTIQNIGIKNKANLVVQLLEEPEHLDEQTMILFLSKRLVETRTYSEKIPHKYTFHGDDKNKYPTIKTLKQSCSKFLNLDANVDIDICKFIPWEFEWKFLDPDQMVQN